MGNANSAVVWGVVLIVLAAAGLVAGAIVFFTRFNRETRRLTEKMCHAGEDGEYRYLAGKLRRHYLLLIPFVTRRIVGRVDRFFTCRQKNAKEKARAGTAMVLLICWRPACWLFVFASFAFAGSVSRGSPRPKASAACRTSGRRIVMNLPSPSSMRQGRPSLRPERSMRSRPVRPIRSRCWPPGPNRPPVFAP